MCIVPTIDSSAQERGVRIVEPETTESVDEESVAAPISFIINDIETLSGVKRRDAYVYLTGNDHYVPDSGFFELQQCINDVSLLEGLFVTCGKIPADRIITLKDGTKEESKPLFERSSRYSQ